MSSNSFNPYAHSPSKPPLSKNHSIPPLILRSDPVHSSLRNCPLSVEISSINFSGESFNPSAHSSLRNCPESEASARLIKNCITRLSDMPDFILASFENKTKDPYFEYYHNPQTKVNKTPDTCRFYIEDCFGNFPELDGKPNIRNLTIRNCIFIEMPFSSSKFPYWIENITIENCYLCGLPRLPFNLHTLIIRLTNLKTIEYFPHQLRRLFLEHNPNFVVLPNLPNTLTHMSCFDCALTELPALPNGLCRLKCWKNRLEMLPPIPETVYSICCAGNPFTKMPFILEFMYYPFADIDAMVLGDLQIDPNVFKVITRFREIYYTVRLRENFKRWKWSKMEREARESLAPERLCEFLEGKNDEDLEKNTDVFFFGRVECASNKDDKNIGFKEEDSKSERGASNEYDW